MEKSKAEEKDKVFIEGINGFKYYSTNPFVMEAKKRSCLISRLYNIFGTIAFVSFITALIVLGCGSDGNGSFEYTPLGIWIAFGVIAGLFVISVAICVGISLANSGSTFYRDLFENTEEFEAQNKKRLKQEADYNKRQKEKKAQDLITVYDTLDDKEMEKEKKINIIKDYMK